MPALRPPSGSSSFSPTGAQPSSPSPPTASKRSRPSLPVADSLPEVSLLAPPGGFVDKRVSKVKTPARKPSEEKATPSLTARPTAPPPPLVHGTGEELQKVADTRTMRNSKKAAEPATDGVMGSSVSRAADSMPHGSTDDLAASPAISPGLTSPKPLAQRPQHSSTSPEMTAGTSAQRLPTSKRAKAKLLASVNSLTTPLPARAPAAAEPSTSAAAPVSPPLEEGVKSTGSQAAPLADPQAAPQADPQAAPRTAPLNQKPQRDSSLSGPAAGNNAELPSKAQSAEAEVTPKRLSLSKAGLASKRPLNSTNDAPPGQLFVVEQPSSTDLVSPAQADTDSKLVKPHPKNRISDPLDESAWRPDANTAARQSADSAVELQAVQLESPPDRLGGAVEPSLPSSPRQPKRPTPVLAERPARPLVLPADLQHRPPKKWDQFNTLESPVNTLEESLQFAQRLKDEQRQLPVVIVAANAGGVLVTNRMLKGKWTTYRPCCRCLMLLLGSCICMSLHRHINIVVAVGPGTLWHRLAVLSFNIALSPTLGRHADLMTPRPCQCMHEVA